MGTNDEAQCDETGPPCANCRVRNEDCDFVQPSSLIVPDPGQAPPATNATVTVGSKRLELELLHQWTSETYRSFVFKDGDEVIWQTSLPQTAFRDERLLHSIFSMSALHRSVIGPSHLSNDYRLAALEYQNLAIAAFRSGGPDFDAGTSPTLFAFSAIHLVLSVAFPACQGSHGHGSIIGGLNTVLELLRGTVSIFKSARPWLSTGLFSDIVRRPQDLQRATLDADTERAFERLRKFKDEDFAAQMSSSRSDPVDVHTFESMTEAIEDLERSFQLVGDQGQIVPFSWLANLRPDVVDRVNEQDALGLLVIMYWAVLLNSLGRDRWWAKSAGKMLVVETTTTVVSRKPEWISAAAWVHSRVGLPPPVHSA